MSFTSTYNSLSVRGYQAPSNTYIGRLATGNNSANQNIGQSMALSSDGNTLIVGATSTGSAGKVLVFTKVSNVWTITANINRPTSNVTAFGFSVDINSSGNTAIIGAPSFVNVSPGYSFIYANVSNTWTLQTTLSPSPVSNIDLIGYSVAINGNGDKFATGTPGGNAAANVYPKVFTFGAGGVQTAILQESPLKENLYGANISMDNSGNYIAVSTSNGNAYIYNNLTLQQTITSNTGSGNVFAMDCSFNSAGNRVLIAPTSASGLSTEIWDRTGNSWSYTSNLVGTSSTINLAPNGNAAVVGTLVYIENNPGSWTVPLILQPNDITYEPAGGSGPFSSAIQYPGYIFAGYPNEDSPATNIGAVGVWQLT